MIIIILTFAIFISYNIFFRNNEVEALSKYGSRGDEVTQIQTKLKRWGYYTGSIDGIYGDTIWFDRAEKKKCESMYGIRTEWEIDSFCSW